MSACRTVSASPRGRRPIAWPGRVAWLSTSNLALELILGHPEVVVSVRGLTYGGRAENARRLGVGDRVVLEREPDDSYDANAILVRLGHGPDLGYAARGIAGRLDEDPDAIDATVREVDASAPMLRLDLHVR